MRLGLMGGTFDPIHYGHLFVAEEARAQFALERVLFVPNGNPPHKERQGITASEHRFRMAEIAVASNKCFACDDMEMQGSEPHYAVDTLNRLKNRHPDAELFYITGIDAIAEILTWKRHEEVISLTRFIAATRPGFAVDLLESRLPENYKAKIEFVDLRSVGLEISSTEIRRRVAEGLPVRYLVPDLVLDYICLHNLYRDRHAEGPVEDQDSKSMNGATL